MQASVGGSLKATIDRLAGTVVGAIWGAVLGVPAHQAWRQSIRAP
jgi:uncharacterized membrane protein YgaE (UPF0421/DUF939 family)